MDTEYDFEESYRSTISISEEEETELWDEMRETINLAMGNGLSNIEAKAFVLSLVKTNDEEGSPIKIEDYDENKEKVYMLYVDGYTDSREFSDETEYMSFLRSKGILKNSSKYFISGISSGRGYYFETSELFSSLKEKKKIYEERLAKFNEELKKYKKSPFSLFHIAKTLGLKKELKGLDKESNYFELEEEIRNRISTGLDRMKELNLKAYDEYINRKKGINEVEVIISKTKENEKDSKLTIAAKETLRDIKLLAKELDQEANADIIVHNIFDNYKNIMSQRQEGNLPSSYARYDLLLHPFFIDIYEYYYSLLLLLMAKRKKIEDAVKIQKLEAEYNSEDTINNQIINPHNFDEKNLSLVLSNMENNLNKMRSSLLLGNIYPGDDPDYVILSCSYNMLSAFFSKNGTTKELNKNDLNQILKYLSEEDVSVSVRSSQNHVVDFCEIEERLNSEMNISSIYSTLPPKWQEYQNAQLKREIKKEIEIEIDRQVDQSLKRITKTI